VKHSTLRSWVKTRVSAVVADTDAATDWVYVDNIEDMDMDTHRGQRRHYDLRWGPSVPEWTDGPKAPYRLRTTRDGEIRILYPVARNDLSDVEDMACDDADLIVAELKTSSNRLAETSDGSHARTQAQHTGLSVENENTIVVSTIQIQIEHRRKRSPLGA